jgi:tRNA nucleotidyltransferase (CCA-adding enzyme)
MEIITSHGNADFDSLAAAVAAQKIYPGAKIVLTGSQDRNVREFLTLHEDVIEIVDPQHIVHSLVKRLILVDTKIGRRLGELKDIAYREDVEVFVFDHHPPTYEDVPVTQDFSEHVGATTTILVKIIRDKGLKVTPFEATLFALGIHEDTGSLTFKTTTYADADAIAYLMANEANLDVIHKFLNPTLTGNQHALLDRLIHTARIVWIKSTPIMITETDVSEYVEGASVVVHKLADIENTDVVFALLSREDRVSIIARSRNDAVNVGDILEEMGGGGHAQAASASVKDMNVDQAREKLLRLLEEYVLSPVSAGQIMSSPVRVLPADTKIREANKLMIRYGHSGLPVVEDGQLVGLIGRREIDKAAHHGLSHAPVKGFMVRRIEPISPDTSLPEIQRIMQFENLSRLPVIENNKIIGIVTKSDVLKALAGDHYFEKDWGGGYVKAQYTRAEINQKIKSLLPGPVQSVLQVIGDIADDRQYKVYLVGGIVRDLLLNVRNLDVDVVVEGNAIEFAQLVLERLGGRIRAHQKFGTAVLILPDGFKIDFASARAEFYEKPAALPQVEPTSIRQDLARRDFSINAMAVSLNKHDQGRLLDFFNGQRDLKNGKIRILHNLSFVEDPTRIFRAVRFEQRLGFEMDSDTEGLVKKAVDMDLVGHLSEARVRDELMLILNEEAPFRVLKRLSDLGVLKILDAAIRIGPKLKALFAEIDFAIDELKQLVPNGARKKTMYAAALLRKMKRPKLAAWCERMKLKKTDTVRLIELVTEVPKVVAELKSEKRIKNSRIYELLNALSPEAIVYAYALAGVTDLPAHCEENIASKIAEEEKVREESQRACKRIMFYLTNLRGIKLSVNGRDLRDMGYPPSPMYNIVLKELLTAKLNGRVKTPEDEVNFVVERLKKAE